MRVKDEDYYLNTRRGRLEIQLALLKHRLQYELPDRFWRGLAYRLPRRLALYTLVRVAAGTVERIQPPDRLTYADMFQRWEAGQGR